MVFFKRQNRDNAARLNQRSRQSKAMSARQKLRSLITRSGQFETLEQRQLLAADPQLLFDINPNGDSNPREFVEVGTSTFFVASDGVNGTELWKTDGTAAGTVMVKDIREGANGSDPSRLTAFQGKLFFAANDGNVGRELWTSDGTSDGTVLVKDVNTGGDSRIGSLTVAGDNLFFYAENDTSSYELFKSDGTTDGTVLVKDINPNGGSYPDNLTNVNGTLFFTAQDENDDRELWKSDGEEDGTVRVADIDDDGSSNPRNLTNVDGTLFFTADDGTNGRELWKSNGEEVGTELVSDILEGEEASYPFSLTDVDGTLFFSAYAEGTGRELWKSDGSEEGTVLVADILDGNDSSSPQNLTNVGGKLFFSVFNNENPYSESLFTTNETLDDVIELKDVNLYGESGIRNVTDVNGTAYFTANNYANRKNNELWKSDGTAAGTILVKDINPDLERGSYPNSLTNISGALFFSASNGTDGREVFTLGLEVVDLDTIAGDAPFRAVLDPNDATMIQIVDDNRVLQQTIHKTSVTSLRVNGTDGDDTFTVDFSNGDPAPAGGIHFHGGAQATAAGDAITVTGANANLIEYRFDNANDGGIRVDGAVIEYVGLEPVIDNSDAFNRVFTFTGGAETITLSDDATAGDGFSMIDSTLGELVIFLNPTNSLSINAGSGADQIDIDGFDTLTSFDLAVNGDAGANAINFNNALDFGTGNLLVNGVAGDTTTLAANLTSTGTQTFNTPVTLGADVTVAGSAVAFGSTVDGGQALTVNSAGATTFAGAVGATTPLTSVATNVGGTTNINGGGITTTAAQTYNDSVILGASTTLAGVAVTLADTVDGTTAGTEGLTINDSGLTTLGAAIGNTTSLLSLTTDGPGTATVNAGTITTTGGQQFFENLTLGADLVTTGFGSFFAGGVDGAFNLTLNDAATANFSGFFSNVGTLTPLASITTDAAGGTRFGNIGFGVTIATTGNQTYGDTAVAVAGVNAVTWTSTGGVVSFGSTLDIVGVGTLNINSLGGSAVFSAAVGATAAPGAMTVTTAGPFVLGQNVTTVGDLTINVNDTAAVGDDFTLTGGATLTSNTGSVAITAGDDVDLQALTTISAAAAAQTVTVNLDPAAGDPDVGVGSTATINAAITATTTNINGGDDADNITPLLQGTTTFSVDGNLPAAAPGDVLTIDAMGNAVAVTPTGITVTGLGTINYAEIESFNLTNAGPTSVTGDANDNVFTLAGDLGNGNAGTLTVDGGPTITIPGGTAVTMTGLAGDDTLVINEPGALNPIPAAGLTFNAGTQGAVGDSIMIQSAGTGTFNTITYNYAVAGANGNDGNINFDGNLLTYTGLEPIVNMGNATNMVFILPPVANPDAVLSAAGAGMNQLTGSTFENTTFMNPAVGGSLMINGGGLADVINVAGVDGAFNANVTISGLVGDDTINFQTANTNVGAGNVVLNTETANFAAGLITTGNLLINSGAGGINDTGVGAAATTDKVTANNAAFAGNNVGSAANPLELSVNSLFAGVGAAGDIFITEANGLTDLELTGNNVTLALTLGGIVDTLVDGVDVTATNAIITLNDPAAQNVGSVGNPIETTVGTLNLDTSAGNGSQFINETDAISVASMNAGTGDVTLFAGGAITSAIVDGVADIVGSTLFFRAFNGPSIGTSAASRLEVDAVTLNAINQGILGSDDIFIVDTAGGFAIGDGILGGIANFNGGVIDLQSVGGVGGGGITTSVFNGTPDIAGGTINLAVIGGAGAIGTAGAPIELVTTAPGVLNATTVGGAGDDISINDAAFSVGISSLNLNAGALGNVTLATLTALSDTDAADDITAANATVTTTGGMGTLANPINTSVAQLDVSDTGGGALFVTESDADGNGLTLATLTGANAVTAPGGGAITSLGGLSINGNAISAGGMTYTAVDSPAVGDDVTIPAGVTVQDTTAGLTFNAGDDFTATALSIVTAVTTVTINVDPIAPVVAPVVADADPGVGSIVIIAGTVNAPNTNVNGGDDSDTFTPTPQATTIFNIDGNLPALPTSPGDVLNLDAMNAPVTVTATGVVIGGSTVNFQEIETLNLTNVGPITVVGDANDNTLVITGNGGVADSGALTLDGGTTVNFAAAGPTSITFNGLGGDDALIVDETINGLPILTGAAPGSHINTAYTASGLLNGAGNQNVGIHMAAGASGGANNDRLQFIFANPQTLSTFDDVVAAANSGVANIAGAVSISYDSLTPIIAVGAGGSFLADASALPTGADLVIADDLLDTAGAGGHMITGTAGFESRFVSGFANLVIRSGLGGNAITLAGLDPAGTETTITLDGDDIANADASTDFLTIQSLPAGVTANMFGGAGGDNFTVGFLGNVDNVLGQIFVSPAGDEAGLGDSLNVFDFTSATGDTITLTSTTIEGITPSAAVPDITYNTGDLIENILIVGSNNAVNTFNIQSTQAGSTYSVDTGIAGAFSDIVNIASDAPINAGNLNGIQGQVTLFVGSGPATTVNVSDAGDAAGDVYDLVLNPFTSNTELYFNDGGAAVGTAGFLGAGATIPDLILHALSPLANFNLIGDTGANTYNVFNTTATVSNTITDGGGNSTFNIQGDRISAGAANTFGGAAGTDTFNVNFAANTATPSTVGTTFQINGGALATSSARDVVFIQAAGTMAPGAAGVVAPPVAFAFDAAPRNIGLTYADATKASGDLNVTDALSTTTLDLNTVETVVYFGDANNNDIVTVTGTTADDDLTVAPYSNNQALVFLDGDAWDGPSEGSQFDQFPGVAGGSAGPDLDIWGVRAAGVNVAGGGAGAAGDQLYVYAVSEADLVDAATTTDPFGFGVGVIMPGSNNLAVPGLFANAHDLITVANNTSVVTITNDRLVPGAIPPSAPNTLLPIIPASATFAQANPLIPGLLVNAGFEVLPAVDGIADDIQAFLSTVLPVRINGGDPVPALAPNGDRLQVFTFNEINVFSDKSTPPIVSVTSTVSGTPTLPLSFSSIESTILTAGPGSQQANLIGDNNNPLMDQNDQFIVIGEDVDSTLGTLAAAYPGSIIDTMFEPDPDGDNEFTLQINGSAKIGFRNITDLNVFGDDRPDLATPGTPSVANDIDTLNITPYADDTPQGWGIDVSFDEGNPVGAGAGTLAADLIIYNTAGGGGMVSEDIVIRPSGLDAGEIVVTNKSFGTPIVDIDFVFNTDIVVIDGDGFLNDTDTLTLLGTNPDSAISNLTGNDHINVDLTNNGDAAAPIARVLDLGPDGILNSPDTAAGAVAGDDILLYRVRTNPVAGALPFTFDTLNIDTLGGDDSISIVGRNDGTATVNVAGSAGNDTLLLTGTAGANDAYTIGDGSASVQLSGAAAETTINHTGIDALTIAGGGGAGTDTLNLSGDGSDNTFTATGTPLAGTIGVDAGPVVTYSGFGTGTSVVNINGQGGADQVDYTLSGAGTDAVTYTPTASNGGQLMLGAAVGNVVLAGIETLNVDALEGAGDPDALTIAMASATISSTGPESGVVTSNDLAGNALLSLNYSHFETAGIAAGSGTGVIQGTEGNDLITVAANGDVTVTDEFGNTNTFASAGFTNVVINSLGGDDTINITPGALIFSVVGGDNGDGSDTLNFTGAGAAIAHSLTAGSITEAALGAVSYTGVEHVNINGGAQALTVTGTAGNDVLNVTPIGNGQNGRYTHDGSTGVDFTYSNSASITFAGGAGTGDLLSILGDEAVDAITATANTITVDGSVVTIGAGLEALKVTTLGGDDNVNLTGFTNGGNAMSVEIYGGIGDDTIRGSDLNDVIFGGSGNDILMGGIGNDTQHGEDGRDIFGNPGLAADANADDPGTDFNFGGAGDDNFVWEPGDGTDFNQGGNDGADIFRFFGRAATADTFTLRSGGTPTHLNAVFNAATIDNHGVEDFLINPLTGNDTININDIFATEVVNVTVVAGGGNETVNVAGRSTDDNVSITTPAAGVVDIEGLSYDISLTGAALTDALTFNSGAGADTLSVGNGVELLLDTTINGDGGNDSITGWFTTANGGTGNDTLIGAANNNAINGGAGDDLIDGRGGNNTIDGGAGTDTTLVSGTAAGETIGVVHTAGTLTVTGGLSAGVNAITTTEAVRVEAGDGSDMINITTLAAGGLNYEVLGGNPIGAVGDTLNVTSANPLTFMAGPESDSGSFTDDTTGNIVSFDEIEAIGVTLLPIAAITVMGTGDDDEITVIGLAANSVSVQINDGPAIVYAGINTLNIQGKSGDDDITLDLEVANLAVAINVDGGLPTTDQDRVRVTGVDGTNDTPNWTPSASDAGVLQLAGQQPITITNSEEMVYDGEGDNETLTVTGTAGVDTFVHQPGSVADAGSVRVDSTLGVAYEDLGTTGSVTLAGAAGNDIVVANGTASDDTFTVAANGNVVLTTTSATHVTLQLNGITGLTVDGLGGDDTFNVTGTAPIVTTLIGGDNGDGSDVLNYVQAAAATLDLDNEHIDEPIGGAAETLYSGIETINIVQATFALTVEGSNTADDVFDVTARGANDVTIQRNGTFPIVNANNTTGTITLDGLGGTGDQVIYNGTAVTDTITVNVADVTHTGFRTVNFTAIEDLEVHGHDGDDTITAIGATSAFLTLFGGDGNDTLTGGANADLLFGGTGNDTLIGGGGNDTSYGEAGNDRFGNPTDNNDGTADDPGVDTNFGGAGLDTFVWEPGDGPDINVGGDDGADRLRFFGNAGVNTITLQSSGVPTQLDVVFGVLPINNTGIEDFFVDPLGGNDVVTINDLFATEAVSVDVVAGGGNETITVNGRGTADDLTVNSPLANEISVEGFSYDIDISGAAVADILNLNTLGDDDNILIENGVQNFLTSNIDSGAGDDSITGWFNTATGGAGDDTIRGAANAQALNGGDGEDTLVGGAGADNFDGGAGFDTILIEGTSGADVIDVFQALPTSLQHTVNGTLETDTLVVSTIEQAHIVAGDGADVIRVNWLDAHGVNAANDALRMTVDGGDDSTSDRLAIVDNGTADLMLYRKGQDNDSGTVQIGPGNNEPLLTVFSGVENLDFVNGAGTAVNNAAGTTQLVVFKHDPFESNDDRFTATYLGSGDAINVDPNIDPGPFVPFGLAGDVDVYRLVAETTGTLDFQVYFRQVGAIGGRPGLPNSGNLDINVMDASGNVIAGFGVNDATDDERVRIPAVEGQTYYLQVSGAAGAINTYNMSVINHAPATPFDLELLDNPVDGTTNPPGTAINSDTGRSQFDNITYDTTPTIYFRLDDGAFLNDIQGNTPPLTNNPPNGVAIPIPFAAAAGTAGYRVAIFDEGNAPAPGTQTGTAPQTPIGFATQVPGQQGVYQFTSPVLSNGSHFLSARVQITDPSAATQTGFGPRSESLEIIVDSVAPPASFGETGITDDGLHPDSDTGNPNLVGTLSDNITSDLTPTFFGRAEANAIVRLYLDSNGDGIVNAGDLFLGQDVANPLDGTNQHPGGAWQITSTVGMNDPAVLAALGLAATDLDGVRPILIQAEDVAGNISPDSAATRLTIFVDTQGPQVSDVRITGNPTFDLFTLKPGNVVQGPTPRVDSITVSVEDLPVRTAAFLYAALSNVDNANAAISVIGDHSGIVPITSIVFNDTAVADATATGTITLTFAEPLPDDRFTLTIEDGLIDPVGNQLDGETDASRPIGAFNPNSGDNIPGGDFVARFTVDSRPEVGSISQGLIYVDINGNQVFDPEGQDNDAVNRDFVYQFGRISDGLFAGNFGPAGTAGSGFDKLAAYGALNSSSSNPQYSFLIDTNDDGVGDVTNISPFQVNGVPVAGNFFNSPADVAAVAAGGRPSDEVGLFDGQNWYLDTDGDFVLDTQIATSYTGIPMVGDFNGDGVDDLAVYENDTNVVIFDTNRDGNEDSRFEFGRFPGLSGFTDKPVVGDLNLDGVDDFGIWVKGRGGVLPHDAGEYFFWLSDNPLGAPNANAAANFNEFSPDTLPGGNDLFTQWGDEFALPILGNFDPVLSDVTPVDVGSSTNQLNSADVNSDGDVTALDALILINALNDGNQGLDLSNSLRAQAVLGPGFFDVDGNEALTAIDALRVINVLNDPTSAQSEPLSKPLEQVSWQESVDSFFEDDDDDDEEILDDVLSLMF